VSKEEYEELRERSKETPLGGVGPGMFFARHLERFIDRPLGLIPNSPGGSTMKHWDPGLRDRKGDSLYGAMMDRIEMVGGKVKGVLWYQGESEALDAENVSAYEAALLNLFDSLRRDTGQADLPILYVQISRYAKSNDSVADTQWETIRETQRKAAQKRTGVYLVSAADLPVDDELHLNYEGQERLGRRLAEIALTHVYGQEGHAHPIDLESVKVVNAGTRWPEIHLRFSGVTGRLTAPGQPAGFEVRVPSGKSRTPQVFRADLDPADPASVVLRLGSPLEKPVQLYYGSGMNPYINIVDEKDIPIPAFGPIDLDWE
jgi:sialate O-acetylesterase